MDAAIFTIKPNAQELTQYKDAILFGYQQMDRLLGNMMKLAGPEARIIFATGLSQQPYLKHEHLQGQNFYRPHSINDLLSKLGVMAQVVQSVMTHQFLAHFENQNETDRARYILESLTLDGNVIFGFGGGEPNSLYFGSQIHTVVSSSSEIVSSAIPEFGCKFFDIFYRIDDLKSGRHHPDGCLWIQSGKHRQHADKVSILDILPTICKLLNVPISGYVGRPLV